MSNTEVSITNSTSTWRADEFIKVRWNMKYPHMVLDDETSFWIAQQVFSNKYSTDISCV